MGFCFLSLAQDTEGESPDRYQTVWPQFIEVYWQTYSLTIATVSASIQKHNIKILFCYFNCRGRSSLLISVDKDGDKSTV